MERVGLKITGRPVRIYLEENMLVASRGFFVELRVDHPSRSAEVISAEFGRVPVASHSAGAPRKTPRGELLGGAYRATYLLFEFGEFENVSSGLVPLFAFVDSVGAPMDNFVASGGSLQVIVRRYYSSELNGFELDLDLVVGLSWRRLGLGFEVI